jgi:hypothetical protein
MGIYDASQIKVLENVPDLEQLENGECRRTYIYRFVNILPEQNEINRIANSLGRKFTFSTEITERPEELEIYANVIIERSLDYEAKVSIVTTLVWEERYVFVFGLRTLPRKLEEEFGTVESLQGLPRDRWSCYD